MCFQKSLQRPHLVQQEATDRGQQKVEESFILWQDKA